MKKKLVDRRRVLRALHLLVGRLNEPRLPKQITACELKQFHRARVFENHPDRAAVLGRSLSELQRKLVSINAAYEFLNSLMTNDVLAINCFVRDPIRVREGGRRVSATIRSSSNRVGHRCVGQTREYRYRCREARYAGVMEQTWGAGIPQRRLRFGRFLYYSGAIKWNELVRSVEWQAKQRPLFGEIAREMGFLTNKQIERLLDCDNDGELLGDGAVRRGLLSNFQRLVILGRQLNLQRPLGEYFVACGMLSTGALEGHLRLHQRHNGTLPRGGFPKVA